MKKAISYVLLITWIVVSITAKYLFQFVKEVLEALWQDRHEAIPWTLTGILGWLIFSILACVLQG